MRIPNLLDSEGRFLRTIFIRFVPLREMQAKFGEDSVWVFNILRVRPFACSSSSLFRPDSSPSSHHLRALTLVKVGVLSLIFLQIPQADLVHLFQRQ